MRAGHKNHKEFLFLIIFNVFYFFQCFSLFSLIFCFCLFVFVCFHSFSSLFFLSFSSLFFLFSSLFSSLFSFLSFLLFSSLGFNEFNGCRQKGSIAGNWTRGANVRGLHVTNYTTMDYINIIMMEKSIKKHYGIVLGNFKIISK